MYVPVGEGQATYVQGFCRLRCESQTNLQSLLSQQLTDYRCMESVFVRDLDCAKISLQEQNGHQLILDCEGVHVNCQCGVEALH